MSGSRWTEERAAEWLHGPLEPEIRNGAVYYLKCLGSLEGNRWLDGRTIERLVGLAPRTTYPYTGTRWRAHKLRDGAWAFRCLGDFPGNRWLDGRTADASVGLAPYPDGQFSGARWQPIPVRDGVYILKCLGEIDGNRYLDGVTVNATTRLAPHPDYPNTGAHWELRRERWWVGCNFIPSTAVNQLEMWQQETFDPMTIKRELGWARELGFNAVRVFLHDRLWLDPNGFKDRIRMYLDCAATQEIGTLFVFFDDCWYSNPNLGKQPDPWPDTHNSRWVQSPGDAVVANPNPESWGPLQTYVQGVISEFGDDSRVIGWDLYNEPGGGLGHDQKNNPCPRSYKSLPLVQKVFEWARAIDPSQPLTAGVFSGEFSEAGVFSDANACKQLRDYQLNNSDIISFHRYAGPEIVTAEIKELKKKARPLLCTEYLARSYNSRFENHLALFRDAGVGCFNWGLVAGKTQTFLNWGWEPRCEWHHDVLRTWGTPYSAAEEAIIKCLIGKEPTGAGIRHNAIYRFKCLGHLEGDRWLDGRTAISQVGLVAEHNLDQYSGTRWRAIEMTEGVFAFRCLGEIEGNRWLDGRTQDGSIGLAPDPNYLDSGTYWQLCRVRNGAYIFRCLGDVEGPRLLDGRTVESTVGLTPHSGTAITGIYWEAVKISDS